MRNHPIFRKFDLEEDSCIAAAHQLNQRYLERQSTERDVKQERETYMATDADLPEIFFQPIAARQKEEAK